jgi:hypothetical protein
MAGPNCQAGWGKMVQQTLGESGETEKMESLFTAGGNTTFSLAIMEIGIEVTQKFKYRTPL